MAVRVKLPLRAGSPTPAQPLPGACPGRCPHSAALHAPSGRAQAAPACACALSEPARLAESTAAFTAPITVPAPPISLRGASRCWLPPGPRLNPCPRPGTHRAAQRVALLRSLRWPLPAGCIPLQGSVLAWGQQTGAEPCETPRCHLPLPLPQPLYRKQLLLTAILPTTSTGSISYSIITPHDRVRPLPRHVHDLPAWRSPNCSVAYSTPRALEPEEPFSMATRVVRAPVTTCGTAHPCHYNRRLTKVIGTAREQRPHGDSPQGKPRVATGPCSTHTVCTYPVGTKPQPRPHGSVYFIATPRRPACHAYIPYQPLSCSSSHIFPLCTLAALPATAPSGCRGSARA